MKASGHGHHCSICNDLRDGWEASPSYASSGGDPFPQALDSLSVIKRHDGVSAYTLYQCPGCGIYYLRQGSQEWDSYEELMRDIERLSPLNDEEARRLLSPVESEPRYAEINNTRRCSKCRSARVKKLRDTRVGSDILVWYRCETCGNEEYMDAYEVPEDER